MTVFALLQGKGQPGQAYDSPRAALNDPSARCDMRVPTIVRGKANHSIGTCENPAAKSRACRVVQLEPAILHRPISLEPLENEDFISLKLVEHFLQA